MNQVDKYTVKDKTKELLEEIDNFLAYLEDFTKGEEGKRITKLRGKLQFIYGGNAAPSPAEQDHIYIIEKLWTDSMENEVSNARGYSSYGFFDTYEEANEFRNKGKVYTQADCWAITGEANEYLVKQLPRLK